MANGEVSSFKCLTYCPVPYNGRGWTETCVNLLMKFHKGGITPVLLLPRASKALPRTIIALESLPFPISKLPWTLIRTTGTRALEELFRRQIAAADPNRTVAYFWPGTPTQLVEETRKAGILTVRQMINTFQGTAKQLLDRAYSDLSLSAQHPITKDAVIREIEELKLYDYVFAPNPEVEKSLRDAGVAAEQVVSTSFGWSSCRFDLKSRMPAAQRPLRFLFVGMACVRKGIPTLLEAWKNAGIKGELVIVGNVEAAIQDRLTSALREGSVRHISFTDEIDRFYCNSDVFVFPTIEEGGPQVTLEAGGVGLPVITTPMGAARLVKHGVNGLIVEAGNVAELTHSLLRLAESPKLRSEFSKRIREDSKSFTYEKVSTIHGEMMVELLNKHVGLRFGGGKW